ncbi:MAG TPA: hypothetical protein EYQ50_15070 [Verrucomicrobiales bacterium]|nr:hypothetical protein [Verrucomicrobiales bacterium]HIL68729.1 hypothetical protein [Verrucomicrobiota bacterium]
MHSKKYNERRRLFPTRALKLIFWSYIVFFFVTFGLLYMLHAVSVGSLQTALRLQIINVLAMGLQGWFVFLLVRLFYEIKFTQFLGRMDRELRQMLNNGAHRIHFRSSNTMPWYIEGLNELCVHLFERFKRVRDNKQAIRNELQALVSAGNPSKAQVQQLEEHIQRMNQEVGDGA